MRDMKDSHKDTRLRFTWAVLGISLAFDTVELMRVAAFVVIVIVSQRWTSHLFLLLVRGFCVSDDVLLTVSGA